MRNVLFPIVAVFLVITISNCATNPVTGKKELMLISEDEEVSLGTNVAPQIECEFGNVYNDVKLNTYVDEVGQKVAAVAHYRPKVIYHFKVLNTNIVNAFALPGGFVYITRGLLIRLNNESQLAAVLGHETTHVAARHSASQISKAIGMSILLQAGVLYTATRDTKDARASAAAVSTVGNVIGNLILLGYGREAEYESDNYGIEYIYKAGYNPQGMVQVLAILKDLQKHKVSGIEAVLQSHPPIEKRIENAQNEILIKYPDHNSKRLEYGDKNFAKCTGKFRKDYAVYEHYDKAMDLRHKGEYSRAMDLINEAIKLNSDEPSFYVERARISLAQGNHSAAERNFLEAKERDPKNFDAILGYGIELYRKKDFTNAEKELTSAVIMIPGDAVAHFYLAEAQYALGKKKEAIEGYKTVIDITKGEGEYAEKARSRLQGN